MITPPARSRIGITTVFCIVAARVKTSPARSNGAFISDRRYQNCVYTYRILPSEDKKLSVQVGELFIKTFVLLNTPSRSTDGRFTSFSLIFMITKGSEEAFLHVYMWVTSWLWCHGLDKPPWTLTSSHLLSRLLLLVSPRKKCFQAGSTGPACGCHPPPSRSSVQLTCTQEGRRWPALLLSLLSGADGSLAFLEDPPPLLPPRISSTALTYLWTGGSRGSCSPSKIENQAERMRSRPTLHNHDLIGLVLISSSPVYLSSVPFAQLK